MKPFIIAFACLLAIGLTGPLHAAAPQAFIAHYEVRQDDKLIGEAVMQLRADDKDWLFTTHTRGKGGMAGLLGLKIDESSRFRMRDDQIEMLDYSFRLDAGIKKRTRSIHADWQQGQVTAQNKGESETYATRSGLVERHLLSLVLARQLVAGDSTMTVPVAVRNRVESQHFHVTGHEDVLVPAGRISTTRLDRSDADKSFTAWYAPERCATPVQLVHDNYMLLLKACETP